MAAGAARVDPVLRDRRDRRPRRLRHRLGARSRFTGRHDQRVRRGLHGRARHQGRVGSARLLRQSAQDGGHSQARRRRRSGSRTACRGPTEYKKQGVRGVSANAIDVVVETGDSGPVTPVGINLPNDQAIREQHGSKSVSLSNANQAYDKSTLPEFRREFAWSAEEAERAEKWSSVAERADDQHARGDRPRLGPDRRASERQSAGRAEGAVLRARGVARRPRRALFRARPASSSSSASSTRPTTTTSSAPNTKATRATRSSSCAACAKGRRSKKTTCATGR